MNIPAMPSVNQSSTNEVFEFVDNGEYELSFRIFDASACQFQAPKVSILPRFSRASFGITPSTHFSSVITNTSYRFYSRGRYALQEAYRLAGVGPQGAILIPSYHCRTMIDPAIRRHGKVILYPLDKQLVPELASIIRLLDSSKTPVVALLLTHYFGFPQKTAELQVFCKARGITLIEDCSHAYFRHQKDPVLGKIGRFVVASPYKFCPAEDGGVLIENGETKNTSAPLTQQSWAEQIRSTARIIRKSLQSASSFECNNDDELFQKYSTTELKPGTELTQPGKQVSRFYQSWIENKAGLRLSHLITRMSHADHIAGRRRANFQRWLQAMQGVPGCNPLFDELPENVVPYMFPLYIERPDSHFYLFKKLGLPIYRWDDQAVSGCTVSAGYRLHLLHLPCHQSLESSEMDWMIQVVVNVMKGALAS